MVSRRRLSPWLEARTPHAFARLSGVRQADVVVVGAGITGLTTAALLKEQGRQVVVLEARRVGEGASGYSSAHLTTHLAGYRHLLDRFGADAIRRVVEARRAAMTTVARLIDKYDIECAFTRLPGYLHAHDEKQIVRLEDEYAAMHEIDSEVSWVDRVAVPGSLAAVRLANQAQLDPVAYTRGLAIAVHQEGSFVFEHSPASEVHHCGVCVVHTPNGEVRATHVVLATHTPIGRSRLHKALLPYRSLLLAGRPNREAPTALFWDLAAPFHFVRGAHSHTGEPLMLIVDGGVPLSQARCEEHRQRELEAYARDRWRIDSALRYWSSNWFDSIDGLPVIGTLPGAEGVFTAGGLGGDGLTLGTLAAEVLTAHIAKRPHPLADLFRPERLVELGALGILARQSARGVLRALRDRVRPPEHITVASIGTGEGALCIAAGRRIAAYRDDDGRLHTFSPACTHDGCVVRWNASDRTWDCPQDGGRYDATGEALAAPAHHPLKALPVDGDMP